MRGRDRKTQARDKARKDDVFEKNVDSKASERFHRPAYQAGSMVRAQGVQMKPRTLIEYLPEKYDIKAAMEENTDGQKRSD